MIGFLARRILIAIPVLIGVSLVAFFLVRLVPGDTATAMLGLNYSPAEAQVLREKYGLDRSLPVQYAMWIANVARGDLGVSSVGGRSVTTTILRRLPMTLQLAAGALVFALLSGVPLGVISAMRRRRTADYAASFTGLIGISVPGFWLGTILILVFSLHWRWFPSGDFVPLSRGLVENLRHMVLPWLALGLAVAAVIMRMSRSTMLEVIGQDYVRTARAKGMTEPRVIFRHALRNALVPVVTIAGLQLGYLLGGSVVIEAVFSLPGIGKLALDAIAQRDYPLLQGVILFVAVCFVMINLLIDVLYAVLDPRIADGGGTGGR